LLNSKDVKLLASVASPAVQSVPRAQAHIATAQWLASRPMENRILKVFYAPWALAGIDIMN